MWYATQVSIRLALVVAVGESIVGVIFGLIWGYVRSLDRFFTELYNLIDNVPYIIYMTLIALMVGQSFWIMAISMIAINWLSMARRVRNMCSCSVTASTTSRPAAWAPRCGAR